MRIISNASPLINLSRIGELDLLKKLYGEIIIPDAVWNEIAIEGTGQPGSEEVRNASWILKRSVKNKTLVHALRQELDAGEAEAIVSSFDIKADLLIMDERIGREVASHFGIKYIGLIGILVGAKNKGEIKSIRSSLDMLRYKAGFFISGKLYNKILTDAGEAA